MDPRSSLRDLGSLQAQVVPLHLPKSKQAGQQGVGLLGELGDVS